jgi:threonylcarbamoyladenosine tRNA methylthiotransferase MtaB
LGVKRIAFGTLGCRVNKYEEEAMRLQFPSPPYQHVPLEEEADIYIINTCTVTRRADHKSRHLIRALKRGNPSAFIVVTGCYAQRAPQEILSIEGVSLVLGNKEKERIREYIEALREPCFKVEDISKEKDYGLLSLGNGKPQWTRAFMKIQDGCDRFCSYCIVPYVRGKPRSRPLTSILEEVKRLKEMGFKEIVLCGINLGMYESDGARLSTIIERIEEIEGIERIRLSSLEPDTIDDELIRLFSKRGKLCPHIHLSLQSGDSELLKRMGRFYTGERFKGLVLKLKDTNPLISITADVIVGFPGEDEGSFLKTYKLIQELGLCSLHIFKYSPRPGTLASNWGDPVSWEVKEERAKRLAILSNELNLKYRERFLGKETLVLIEEKRRDGLRSGLTPEYIRLYFNEDLPPNTIVKALITKIEGEVTFAKSI